jgi:hypothetical protein
MHPALLDSAPALGAKSPLGDRPTGSDAGFWSRRSGFESLSPSKAPTLRAPALRAPAQQAVVGSLPPGTQSVSRESAHPEVEMSNRYGGSSTASRLS